MKIADGRRRLRARFTAVAMAVMVAGTVMAPPAEAAACSTSQLRPEVAGTMVNQGLPQNRLVRGKDVLVRFYLMLPACTVGTSQQIQIKSAQVSVSVGGTPVGLPIPTLNTLAAPPAVAPYSNPATTLPNSTADPLFHIPASALNAAGTDAFGVDFKVDLTYRYTLDGKTFKEDGVASLGPVTATVEKPTNSLRILAMPMGDPTRLVNTTNPQWSADPAEANFVNGLGTLSRIYPVPNGTGNLALNTQGGIRYKLLPTMLPLTQYMTRRSDKKFCGEATNSLVIRAMLATHLVAYNTTNATTAAADRVLGAIDQAVSAEGCAEGYAGIGTKEAWVRSLNDNPNSTGGIIAMEEAHNSGAVPTTRDDDGDRFHASNIEADGGTSRAYNLDGKSFIASDRNVMQFAANTVFNNNNTLLEKPDWDFAWCGLGGQTTSECPTAGTEGAPLGAAAGESTTQFFAVGLTDGTPAGTDVFDSYFAPGADIPAPATSDYFFVQKDDAGSLGEPVPVAVHDVGSLHHPEGGSDSARFFSFAYDHQADANRWELWKGAPDATGSTLLAARDRIGAPEVTTPQAPGAGKTAFDRIAFNDMTPLQPPVAQKGVTFSGSPNLRVMIDATLDPTNTLLNDTGTVPFIGDDTPLGFRIAPGARSVSMVIGNGLPTTTATLTAFDVAGDEVARKEISIVTKAVVTPASIEVSPEQRDIYRVELSYSDAAGLNPSEQIDNLEIEVEQTKPGQLTASATTTGDPNHLRGSFFLRCPVIDAAGQKAGDHTLPLAAGLRPARIVDLGEGRSRGDFEFPWDANRSCEDGGFGQLLFRADNGYELSEMAEGDRPAIPAAPPVAAISSPHGTEILQHQFVALSGNAYDPTDGVLPGARLEWFLEGPEYATKTSVGTGNQLNVAPPDGVWQPGTYTATLVATDFDGDTATATSTVTILEDRDNDGIPRRDEQCNASSGDADPDRNPFNAYTDADGDGISNIVDSSCIYDAAATTFDPKTLFVPSAGHPVTMTVQLSGRSVSDVIASSVHISHIDGIAVRPAQPGKFDGSPIVGGWKIDGTTGVAKFDRQLLTQWLSDRGLVNKEITLTLVGQGQTVVDPTTTASWRFRGTAKTFAKPAK